MLRPAPLIEGDRIAVVAPSGVVDPDRLDAGLAILRDWGLRPEVAPHVLAGHPSLPYLAASDEQRAADFQEVWSDPGIAAVMCARGGYGAQRVVDLLDWKALASAPPKHFVGYSDATALHEAIAMRLGLATVYGPMAAAAVFVRNDATAAHLRSTLFDPDSAAVLTSPTAAPLIPGRAAGVTAGGCLTLLATSAGTPSARSYAGALLCLEDVNEPPYAVDRALTQLLRSGALDGVAGVVLGSWRDCGPEPVLRELFRDRLAPLGVPVAWELGFGHGQTSLAVPLGVPAALDVSAAATALRVGALPEPIDELADLPSLSDALIAERGGERSR